MSFDCSRCLARCKADCCRGPIPMPRALFERHVPIRKVIAVQDIGNGHVVVLGEDETRSTANPKTMISGGPGAKTVYGCCPFLGLDNSCSIYEDRPEVCRIFGSEVDAFMTCSYQAADGRVRARPERRRIERITFEKRDASLKRMGATDAVREAISGRTGIVAP